MKHLNETFTESEYHALRNAKGDRTWREAILEEFDVATDE